MTTPRDLITLALKDCGAAGEGQTPSAENMNDAFRKLNWMLAQWRRKRWLVYHLIDRSFVSTGATTYTVGPGGNYNLSVRPDKLEAAYLRQIIPSQPNPVDFPMDVIESMEEYSRIPLKNLGSFSYSAFYDPIWPIGVLHPWPVPQASIYEVHLILKEVLDRFTTLDQDIVLPEEYEPALELNLVLRLAPAFQITIDPIIQSLAKDSLNVLRQANVQIDTLTMPNALIRPGIYDPYSDQTR